MSDPAPVKQRFWGLSPLVAGLGAAWPGPTTMLLALGGTGRAIGFGLNAASMMVTGLGVALLAGSAVEVEASRGEAPKMSWWALVPLGVGLVVTAVTLVTIFEPQRGDNLVSWGASILMMGCVSVGGGMLIGRSIAGATLQPRVSFFALPQGGGGFTLGGPF